MKHDTSVEQQIVGDDPSDGISTRRLPRTSTRMACPSLSSRSRRSPNVELRGHREVGIIVEAAVLPIIHSPAAERTSAANGGPRAPGWACSRSRIPPTIRARPSASYCGFVRERRMLRTSITNVTSAVCEELQQTPQSALSNDRWCRQAVPELRLSFAPRPDDRSAGRSGERQGSVESRDGDAIFIFIFLLEMHNYIRLHVA